jgi:ribosomal protein S18 acetylase RimI-like enzyme
VNPDLWLCEHLIRIAPRSHAPDVVHAFLFQNGPIDAVVRCGRCGAHALLRMVDWAPPDFRLRVYALAALREEDSALYLRNLARGSCQVSRASAELDALVSAAGPTQQLVALDLRRERVVAAGAPPKHLVGEPGAYPERLPATDDARWFEILGLDKLERVRPRPEQVVVAPASFASDEDVSAFLDLLDAYARDPMGGGAPLPGDVRMRLIPDLKSRMLRGDALVLIARLGGKPVGLAVCFSSYSTFRGRPVLNLHDLAVMPEQRGAGVGRKLLEAVEDAARARRCCKVTLEVREDNARARAIYERSGFSDYAPGDARTRTLFLEKKV